MFRAKIGGQLRLLALGLLAVLASSLTEGPTVRVLFLTDCSPYSDWQSIAMVYSYMYSGHKGPITRVMCCSEEDRMLYNPEMLGLVETHIAPSYASDPVTGDYYVAYNKPGAVIDYLEHVTPEEEWLLVLDSDMIIRKPWRVQDFNLSLGWASGYSYRYLKGVHNELADRHIPEIPKRNDTFAGPVGRRSDMVGGFFFIHRTDLKRLSKLWLSYAADVRADPEAYHLTGDVAGTKRGQKPWIAEMYGYSFGAAKANVWHHWDEHAMMYPGNSPGGVPKVLHYGLKWEVEGYQYDKHWYWKFNPAKCTPWDLTPKRPKEGLFPHPPRPSELTAKRLPARYLDLISVEGVATLNAALCFWYRHTCPSTPQLERECAKAEAIFFETREALRVVEAAYDCLNYQVMCETWAARGECKAAEAYMSFNCRPACKLCSNPKVTVAKELSSSESTLLYTLSHPKGEIMKPQPITGASKQFSLDPPEAATDDDGRGGAQAHVPTTAAPTTATTPATSPDIGGPLPVTRGTDNATRTVTTQAPFKQRTKAVGAQPVEAEVQDPTSDTPDNEDTDNEDTDNEDTDNENTQTDSPTTTTTTTTTAQTPATPTHTATTTTTTGQQGEALTGHEAGSDTGVHKASSQQVRQLLSLCYHIAAGSLSEVKDCIVRAKRGEQWARAAASPKAAAPADGGGDDTSTKASTTGMTHVEAATQPPPAHPATQPPPAHPATQLPTAHPAAQPTAGHPATDPHAHWSLPATANFFGYHMVVVWGLLAAALCAVPSIMVRRRRRTSHASDARRGTRHLSAD